MMFWSKACARLLALSVCSGVLAVSATDPLGDWLSKTFSGRWETNKLSVLAAEYAMRIQQNPDDNDARLRHVICSLGQLAENETFKTYLGKFGYRINYDAMIWEGAAQSFPTWPGANEMVDAAAREALPKLAEALTNLEAIPDTWSTRVVPSEFPVDEALVIDAADLGFAKASIQGLMAALHYAQAYDLSIDWVQAARDALT